MFYIKSITSSPIPYVSGALSQQRRVTALTPPKPVGTSHFAPEDPKLPLDPNRTAVIDAYSRAITQDEPRRRLIFARELMASTVLTIKPETIIQQAYEIFCERRYRHLPVVEENGSVVGLLSDRDVLRYGVRKGDFTLPCKEIMNTPVLAASEDTEIREVADIMTTERIGCMPVISEHGQLLGIITRSDILKTIVGQAPLELWR